MKLFSTDFIKSLYNFAFPKCCDDWCNSDSDNKTNEYGMLLKSFTAMSDINEQINYAKKINDKLETKYEETQIKTMINTYNKLKKERKQAIEDSITCCNFCMWFGALTPVPTLSLDNDEVWGSKRQYLYGKVCSDILAENKIELAPFMCSALNPTGGIAGAENQAIYKGNVTDFINIHSCMHDASGYCYNYHKIGKGYNYLDSWFALPRSSPMSCQIAGLWKCWRVKCKLEDEIKTSN